MRRLLACLVALAAALGGLTALAPPAAAADSGSFSVLTYNVAGLPELISSAPTPREPSTREIGRRIAPYDIVHVQEDFNHHAALYAADTTHPHRTATSGGAGIGSGLNTLSRLPWDADEFERVRWNTCTLGSGDCLTPKGFTFMRVRLAEGVHVDFYNLHTNAGSTAEDLAARAANLDQLTRYMASHSAGNAVVVMGDTNTRWTRAGDTVAEFAAANGLTDAWVRLPRGGAAPVKGSPALTCDQSGPTVPDTCEVVDKVLYRGSRLIDLRATAYANAHADFLTDGGLMLSDHDPIAVEFSWSLGPDYRMSEQFGGPHGTHFNDIDAVPAGARATRLTLRAGSRVDQVALTSADGTTLAHGGSGGTASTLTLGDGEYLVSAHLCQGKKNGHTRIFHARFTTSLGRSLAGGTVTGDCVTRTAPDGLRIAGFHGRSGDEVDKLGLLYTRR